MAIPLVVPLAMGAFNIGSSIFGARKARKAQRRARRRERRKRKEMNQLKQTYASLDTSNPYLNMENTMEDLTINQRQAQFEAQQFQQSQANILGTLRGAAGGSGIASLAQSLAQQGQLQAQRASASIGQQEAMNQRLAAREAGRIQDMERQGDILSRQMRRDQVGTLLGMSQQEVAAERQQGALAQQARFDAISSGASNLTQLGASVFGAEAGTFSSGFFGDSFSGLGGGGTNTVVDDEIPEGGGTGPFESH